MKAGMYLKTVLTVIAACLVLIVIKMYPVDQANAEKKQIINVNIAEVGGRNVFKALPVEIKSK